MDKILLLVVLFFILLISTATATVLVQEINQDQLGTLNKGVWLVHFQGKHTSSQFIHTFQAVSFALKGVVKTASVKISNQETSALKLYAHGHIIDYKLPLKKSNIISFVTSELAKMIKQRGDKSNNPHSSTLSISKTKKNVTQNHNIKKSNLSIAKGGTPITDPNFSSAASIANPVLTSMKQVQDLVISQKSV